MGMFDFLKKDRKEVNKILDLRQLDHLLDYDEVAYEKRKKEDEEEKVRLKKQYGERWREIYDERHHLYVTDKERRTGFNQDIYNGFYILPCVTVRGVQCVEPAREQRMREVYGQAYDRLFYHKKGDPEVVELLLQDAVKTGRWDELPECLQEECKNRMFKKEMAK